MHVHLLFPSSPKVRLVVGDVPVVHFTSPGVQVGFRSGLALLEADHLYMPLGPWLGMMLTTQPEGDVPMNPLITMRMNNLQFRVARRFVICHPDNDPSRCLATSLSILPS